MGRKSLPPDERRDRWVHIRLTPGEDKHLRTWAESKVRDLSVAMREAALEAAGVTDNAGERQPEGAN